MTFADHLLFGGPVITNSMMAGQDFKDTVRKARIIEYDEAACAAVRDLSRSDCFTYAAGFAGAEMPWDSWLAVLDPRVLFKDTPELLGLGLWFRKYGEGMIRCTVIDQWPDNRGTEIDFLGARFGLKGAPELPRLDPILAETGHRITFPGTFDFIIACNGRQAPRGTEASKFVASHLIKALIDWDPDNALIRETIDADTLSEAEKEGFILNALTIGHALSTSQDETELNKWIEIGSAMGVAKSPWYSWEKVTTKMPPAYWTTVIKESTGFARTIGAVLALTANATIRVIDAPKDLPKRVIRGKVRPYLSRSVISIDLDRVAQIKREGRRMARAAARRHDVRGHWVHYLRDSATPGHPHQWTPDPERLPTEAQTCACGAHRTWRMAFERGDASRGWVTKEAGHVTASQHHSYSGEEA